MEKTRVYFTQRCFVFSLVEIGPVVFEKIIKFYQCIFNISLLYPLGKGSVTLEQTWNPLTPECFMTSLFEIGQVVLEEEIFKCQCIFAFSLSSPLVKWCGSLFEETWIPLTKECFMPSLVESAWWDLEKKIYW